METAYDFFTNQTTDSFIRNYWIVVFVEIPRFFMGGLLVIFSILFFKSKGQTPERLNRMGAQILKKGVSIIIAMHNEEEAICRALSSLNELCTENKTIIVVNDGSTDDSHNVCLSLKKKGLIQHYIYNESRGGKAAAVNLGIRYVKTDFFVVMDADTSFDRDALNIAAAYFEDSHVGAVGGNLAVRNYNDNLITRTQQINYLLSITLGRIVRDMLGFYFVASGAFSMYRTTAIHQLGGWGFGPGEDADIAIRLRIAGWTVRFAFFATGQTAVPDSAPGLIKQRMRWDRSLIRLRYRKYLGHVLNPFRASFKLPLALSFFDIYFFTALHPFLFVGFVTEKVVLYGPSALLFIITTMFLFLIIDTFKILMVFALLRSQYHQYSLLLYVPYYTFYNIYFLRFVRLFAVCHELIFRGSYKDDYVPKKVRDKIKRY